MPFSLLLGPPCPVFQLADHDRQGPSPTLMKVSVQPLFVDAVLMNVCGVKS